VLDRLLRQIRCNKTSINSVIFKEVFKLLNFTSFNHRMFNFQRYVDFLKAKKPEYILTVSEGNSEHSNYGLIQIMYLGGCTSCIIHFEGLNKLGVVTHFRPEAVDDHLEEIIRLTRMYQSLKNAQNVALLWDYEHKESRCNPDGNVNKLWCDLEKIFIHSEIDDRPYNGAQDWVGLHVDTKTIISP